MTATRLLEGDHARVEKLFREFGRTTERAVKTRRRPVGQIATELETHAILEEAIFYPAVERVESLQDLVEESRKGLAKVKELREEKMFPRERSSSREELDRLGQELRARKQALLEGTVGRATRAIKKGIHKIV